MSIRSHSGAAPVRPAPPAGDTPLPLVGSSAVAQRAREAYAEAVCGSAPVLIVAEPGLREMAVASGLHDAGRRGEPFVAVDCAAGDALSVEAELLGAPSRTTRDGIEVVASTAAIVRAGAGTLFLTHVLELPAGVQRRLARILRDAEVRAGGRRVPIRCRIVASSSPGIEGEVKEGRFRDDLYRRLARATVAIPPLRERAEDIPELVQRAAAELAGGHAPIFTRAALTVISAPPWTGNLDELQRVLDRVVRLGGAEPIRQEDVLKQMPIDGSFVRVAPEVTLREARRQFEREYIASVLERHHWSMSEAARTLGMERANLYRKTRQLGIVRRAVPPAAS